MTTTTLTTTTEWWQAECPVCGLRFERRSQRDAEAAGEQHRTYSEFGGLPCGARCDVRRVVAG